MGSLGSPMPFSGGVNMVGEMEEKIPRMIFTSIKNGRFIENVSLLSIIGHIENRLLESSPKVADGYFVFEWHCTSMAKSNCTCLYNCKLLNNRKINNM